MKGLDTILVSRCLARGPKGLCKSQSHCIVGPGTGLGLRHDSPTEAQNGIDGGLYAVR